ncbi:MAG: glycosyltransferase [Pirellulales bacterium]
MLELVEWGRSNGLAAKPWLILGKGPSFSYYKQVDLSGYHLLSLNHAVRQLPVTAAHIIDIDVVADCGRALVENCRWLIMPRRPHVHFDPGPKRLEDYFDELPVLRELDAQNRLVWYNLSSSKPYGDSPVIRARFFSTEAALNLLGTVGVRQVRSLGVDGGRGYGGEFKDLEGKTMLANGHDTFNSQFDEIDAIVRAHGIDYAPLMEPLRVFVGTDESQRVATRVLEHSIRKHSSRPVSFQPMFDLSVPTPKEKANRPRTGFSFYRFAIPKLCGYRGRALYVDADMQVFSDLAELWEVPFGSQKVLCTNQPAAPEAWKEKGSFFHAGRQMSVMLLDCSRLDWSVDEVVRGLDEKRYDYRRLMFDLCLVEPDEIADRIPPEWNCLEWYEAGKTKLLHYTVVPAQPWKNDDNPLCPIWMAEFREALAAGAIPPEEVQHGLASGFLKPSLARELSAAAIPAGPATSRLAGPVPAPHGGGWSSRLGRAAGKPWRLLKRSLER